MKTDTSVNCVNLHYLRRRLSCASVDILLLFCLLCRLHILIRFSNLNDVRFNYFFVLKYEDFSFSGRFACLLQNDVGEWRASAPDTIVVVFWE